MECLSFGRMARLVTERSPMFEGLPLLNFSASTGGWLLFGATIVIVLRSVSTGRWLPRSWVDQMMSEKDKRTEAAEKARDIANDQNAKLMAYAETADKVIRSLPTANGTGSGDHHVRT